MKAFMIAAIFCLTLAIPGGMLVSQEIAAPAADPGLAPAAGKQQTAPVTRHPALFLVGDSLMNTGYGSGEVGPWGYGAELIPMFDPAKIHVYNVALGGRSSRSYREEGLWQNLLSRIEPGDWVLMQFGHNDIANSKNHPDRLSGKGNGDELAEVNAPGAMKRVHSYGWYLRQYVLDASSKGGKVVILSPVPRNEWADGKILRGFDGYVQWAGEAAKASGAFYVDLNALAADRYDALGQQASSRVFNDMQHTTKAGARINAESVVAGLKQLKDCPLASFLVKDQTSSAPDGTAERTHWEFDFSNAPAAAGKVHVVPDMVYSDERGFGFEPGAELKQTSHGVTSEKPFYFHIAVPQEGNYKATITFGDILSAGSNTVFAELRRLMLENIETRPGSDATRTIIVNTRTPAISGGGTVKISNREQTQEAWAWDGRLSLQFHGAHPAIRSITVEKVDVPTVYLLGDSTVCDQPNEPYSSWGQMLTRFLKPEIAVANGAESGDSIAPSLAAGRFAKFWGQMKSGDYLLIQYGHNDMKSNAPNALETYANNLRRVVDETRSRGGVPVLITSVSRRTFADDGTIADSFVGYTDAVRAVAKEKDCALIDLQACSAVFYEALGESKSHLAFASMQENTHHSNYGSYEIAKCILMGIKQARLALAGSIVDDFKNFDPSHPDPVERINLPK